MPTTTGPRERPILFSAPMVRALLAGRKTQTRRVVKRQPIAFSGPAPVQFGTAFSPFGVPGDRLWVRETWCHTGTGVWTIADARMAYDGEPIYRADGERSGVKWWPAIHMPREFCRLVLEVTDVRVERLQALRLADARAEGLASLTKDGAFYKFGIPARDGWPAATGEEGWPWHEWEADYRAAFRKLWDGLNAPRGLGWDVNPWVWVVSFRRVEAR